MLIKNFVNTLTRGLFSSLFITLLIRVNLRQAWGTTPHLRHHPRALKGRSLPDSMEFAEVGEPRDAPGPWHILRFISCGVMPPPPPHAPLPKSVNEEYRTSPSRPLPHTSTVAIGGHRLTPSTSGRKRFPVIPSSKKLAGYNSELAPDLTLSTEKSGDTFPAPGWPLAKFPAAGSKPQTSANPDLVSHGSKANQDPISSVQHSEDIETPILGPQLDALEPPGEFTFRQEGFFRELPENAPEPQWWFPSPSPSRT